MGPTSCFDWHWSVLWIVVTEKLPLNVGYGEFEKGVDFMEVDTGCQLIWRCCALNTLKATKAYQ